MLMPICLKAIDMRKFIGFAMILSISGCGIIGTAARSERKLGNVLLDSEREEVLASIGRPDSVRGSKRLENGAILQVDEYLLYSPSAPAKNFGWGVFLFTIPWWISLENPSPYWIQYVDGKLDRWGRAGDWQPNLTADVTVRNK